MIVVMVRIPVGSDEQGEGVIDRFRRRAGMVDNQPGFKGFELLRGDGELISVTRWESRADLDQWMASQGHTQAHPQPTTQPQASMPGNVTTYEVVLPGEGQA